MVACVMVKVNAVIFVKLKKTIYFIIIYITLKIFEHKYLIYLSKWLEFLWNVMFIWCKKILHIM